MAVWSEVKCSKINQFGRSDAEYYKPDYENLYSKLIKANPEKLKKMAFITDGIHSSPDIAKENGVRYISAKCVKDNSFVIDNCIFISKKQNDSNPRTQLRERDIIITTVGTIGNVAVVNEDIIPSNCDRHVGIIRTNQSGDINPYFISIFLNSKYGKFQTLRESAGNVQLNLYISNIGKILIPRFGNEENKIAATVKTAYDKRALSQTLYTQAQELLERELGLDKLVFDKPMSYEARLSEVAGNNRADADYYQTRYKQLRSHVSSNRSGIQRLIDFATVLKPNIDPSKSPLSEFKYVELADINPTLGIINSANTLLGKELPSRARREVTKGDVIASSVVGSVDKAALVDEANDGCLASTGFFHFRPKNNIKPEFLLLLVRSRCVTMQLQQESTGGILSAVPDQRLRNVIIPIIDPSIQNKIADLVCQSHKNFNQSKQLLEQAKRRVEELIEQAVQK